MKKSNLIKIVLGITLSLLVFGGCNQKKDVVDFKLFGDKMATLNNAHDATGLANLYTEDAILFDTQGKAMVQGKAEIEKYYASYFRAFPDVKIEILQTIGSENKVCFEMMTSGTFTGVLSSPGSEVQPTGLRSTLQGAFIAILNPDGLIAEDRTYYDQYMWMKQLGLLNTAEEPK